mmetsp:Transcript_32963/g.55545  ORF Transcript_32963/g.55545 Transcript_32963/m.55545 type:complete len:269 (-) Transcript_32963:544-1350(-)
MNRFSTGLKAVSACGLTVIGHACLIEAWKNSKRHEPSFAIGSADDMVRDSLNTGDLVLFSRPWYKYHLPVAFMIASYKYLFDAEFDHGGVIIINKMGVPYILERTPFMGIQFRPFEQRILRSNSTHILVIPWIPALDLSEEQRRLVETKTNHLLSCETGFAHSEIMRYTSNITLYFERFMLPTDFTKRNTGTIGTNRGGSAVCCTNTQLVLDVLETLDVLPATKTTTDTKNNTVSPVTLKSIHERTLKLSPSKCNSQQSSSDVLVRSS